MLLFQTAYYDRFRCVAGDCPDSCCKEWDVQVDDESAEYYRSLSGPLGDLLRKVLCTQDGNTVMTIIDRRCPMWRSDGLCRIHAELGEDALCKTCREFPRLTHDYGDFVELGLELSCPEAAKLILSAPPQPMIVRDVPGGEVADYDEDAMSILKATRQTMLAILSDSTRPVGQTLALGFLYGCQAQSQLDGAEALPFDAEMALEEARSLAKSADSGSLPDFFLGLELLTPEWEALLHDPAPGSWNAQTLALARYLVERYWLQAVSDYDLYCRVKFIAISCLLVKTLGGDIFRTAQLFSKEIENNIDNVEAILDGAYSHPAFTDDKLLGMLLSE